VPVDAVARRGDDTIVFTVEDDRVGAVPVSGEETEDGFFALREGPEEGTPVVAHPPPGLADGDPVRLTAP